MVKRIVLKLLLSSAVFCIFAALCMFASADETIGVPTGGYFRIKNVASGKYVNVYAGNDADGTNVIQHTGNGYARQRFKFNYDSDKNAYKIYAHCSSNGSNRVLDVPKTDGSVAKGSNVQLYAPSESRAQRWKIVPISGGKYRIYPRLNSSVSLAAYGSANGTSGGKTSTSAGNVYVKAYNSSDTYQQWYIEPDYYGRPIADGDYYVKNLNSNLYLDVVGRGTTSGTLTCQYSFTGRRNQIWTIKYQNGAYRISPKNNDSLSLDVSGASADNGAKLQVYTSTGTIAQQFRIVSSGMGYRIMPRTGNDKKDIVVQSASKTGGANIIQYTHNGTANENWYLEPYHESITDNEDILDYDREKAKLYAETYAETYNSNYLTPGNNDCTNFVSQCLLYGGMYEWDNGDRESNGSWYYGSILDLKYYSSYTWGGADNFCRHWGMFNGEGIQRADKTIEYPNVTTMLKDWDRIFPEMLEGDIVQLENYTQNDVITHSMIIHDDYYYNEKYKVNDVLCAQHTDDKKNSSLYSVLKDYETVKYQTRVIIHHI